MGFLQFNIKDVELTSSKTAKIHGDWELERKMIIPKEVFGSTYPKWKIGG